MIFTGLAASALGVIDLGSLTKKKREGYYDGTATAPAVAVAADLSLSRPPPPPKSKDAEWGIGTVLAIIGAILVAELLCSVFAAYLSWTSNSLIQWNGFAKVIFAVFAFLNGVGYLITHLFNKLDLVRYIRRIQRLQQLQPLEAPRLAEGGMMRGGMTRGGMTRGGRR
jgi:hypothetical protein